MGKKPPGILQLDYRTVELKGCYTFRAPMLQTRALAQECESLLRGEADALLKIETLQVLFRVYARRGMLDEARRCFSMYRDAVSEVIANTAPEYAKAISEVCDLLALLTEFRVLDAGAEEGEGTRSGPLTKAN
jgi:pentatricopeptide repeat protein